MAGKGWNFVGAGPMSGGSVSSSVGVGTPGGVPVTETEDQQRLRFQIELEFVQCLGNPNYLNSQRGYFKDSTFINYLKYLMYWKDPEYVKFLKYPMCLYFLDLLQHEHFRRELVNSQCTKFIDDQQILLWQHYTRRRCRLLQQMAPVQTNGNSEPNTGNNNNIPSANSSNPPNSTNNNGNNNNNGANNSQTNGHLHPKIP